MSTSPIIAQILAGVAPSLLQRFGVALPDSIAPEHIAQAITELMGGSPPARESAQDNLLIRYYRSRNEISDAEFRRSVEMVFDEPEFEAISLTLLRAIRAVLAKPIDGRGR